MHGYPLFCYFIPFCTKHSLDDILLQAISCVSLLSHTEPPFFRTQPSDIGVPPTTAAQFFCSGGGSPQPTVQWFHIDNKTGVEQQLQTSGDVFLSDERLIILHTRSSDEGIYYCKVVSPLGEITSRRGFLTVYCECTYCGMTHMVWSHMLPLSSVHATMHFIISIAQSQRVIAQ